MQTVDQDQSDIIGRLLEQNLSKGPPLLNQRYLSK